MHVRTMSNLILYTIVVQIKKLSGARNVRRTGSEMEALIMKRILPLVMAAVMTCMLVSCAAPRYTRSYNYPQTPNYHPQQLPRR